MNRYDEGVRVGFAAGVYASAGVFALILWIALS